MSNGTQANSTQSNRTQSNGTDAQHLFRTVLNLLVLAFLLFTSPAEALSGGRCGGAQGLEVGVVTRDTTGLEELLYRIEIPEPGILMVEISAPGSLKMDAHLALAPCGAAGEAIVLAGSPTHRVLAFTSPGEWLVRVVASSADRLPTVKKFHTWFVVAEMERRAQTLPWAVVRTVETTFLAPEFPTAIRVLQIVDRAGAVLRTLIMPGTGEAVAREEEWHEVDPDPMTCVDEFPAKASGPVAREEEWHEVDPDPITCADSTKALGPVAREEEWHEVDPDPFRIHSNRSLLFTLLTSPEQVPAARFNFSSVCRDNDTFACATSVSNGEEIIARLDISGGDEEDVYRFRVAETGWTRLVSSGGADLILVLYDARGQRLTTAEGGDIYEVLGQGEYFLRVSSRSSEDYGFLLKSGR